METIINNKTKIEQINIFMEALLAEKDTHRKKAIYDKYQSTINQIEAIDLFYLDMYKNNTNLTIDQIKETADKFVNVFHLPLESKMPKIYDSYLFKYFIEESNAIEEKLNSIKQYLKKDNIFDYKKELITSFELCLEIEKKFLKKENILYPRVEEKVPSTKPLQVLWSLHDDARKLLKTILRELKKEQLDPKNLVILIGKYYFLILGINQKEAFILLPVLDKLLGKEEKDEMYLECLEYGFVFIDNLPLLPKKSINKVSFQAGVIKTKTGYLSLKQFELLLKYIPLDVTFVDEFDKVIYFNDRSSRHFPRNASIIGRLVSNCHPQKSVHIVEKIINAFKNNEKDQAEFWINYNKSTIYINYYAVRDDLNNYMGTLEVSQDITKIKELKGSKTLLDWE